jgi:leucyl aminopeptidase (aminopeptidase T)
MAPLRDPGFRERLAAHIPERRLKNGRCILLMFERDTMSHNVIVKLLFRKYDPDQYTVVRAINSGRDLFVTGLAMHPSVLSAHNTALLERCRNANSLYIETKNGTSLRVELNNSKYQYKSSRGIRQPGKFMVIPPGEVATFPANINGTLVADFAINVNFLFDGDVRLDRNPVTLVIENGKLTRFDCSNPEITVCLSKWFQRTNATYVGELGFGTNKAVVEAVPENSHLNERIPGVHLGFGQHNQADEVAGYSCDIHIDLCAKGGLVWFDDSPEPIDLTQILPSCNPHPDLISGEDVFSADAEDDCCGMLR